jgi:outer membrane protein TolC
MLLPLMFVAGLSFAEALKTLSLQECCQKARLQLASVLEQAERINQADEHIRQVKAPFMPDAHFLSKKTFQDSVNSEVPGEFTETKLQATQSVFNGFKDKSLLAIAKDDLLVQQLLLKSAMRDACSQAVLAFYNVALPEVDITNDAENVSMIQDRMTELDARVRLGKSRETELFSVQSTLASVKADLAKSGGSRTAALASLGLLIGEEATAIDVAAESPDNMDIPSLGDALASVHNRSDLVAARKAVEEQELKLEFDKGAFLPMLNVIGNEYFFRPTGFPSSWDVALSLDYPLFQGGRDRAQLRIDESVLVANRIALAYQERQAEADVRAAHATLASSIEQYAFLKDANDKAEAAYRSLVKEYRLGLVNNLDVLAGLSTFLSAKSAYTRAAVQVRENRALLLVVLEQI